MENYRRLFKEAERIKPGESMWRNIAAAAARAPAAVHEAPLRESRPWRLAASMAVGLGAVAALAVLFREPPAIASGDASRDGSEDAAVHQLATADAGDDSFAEGLQEWHADLGLPADDAMLLDPLLEE